MKMELSCLTFSSSQKLLEEKAAQNQLKTLQHQQRQREERKKLLEDAKETRFAQMSELEAQLKVKPRFSVFR